jgi:type I restriction enzyme R subunit
MSSKTKTTATKVEARPARVPKLRFPFVDGILDRMIFDGERLSDLTAPLDLGWKAHAQAELALMADLHPLLTRRAGGRDISGLSAYEQ